MASLENASIASSYTSLLKLSGNTDNLVAGASGDAIQIVDGNGTGSSLYLNTDRIGIGIDSPLTNLHVSKETDITNTTTDVMRLSHTTTGSSAVGFGAVIRFDGERTGSTTDQIGNIGFVADAVSSSTINGAFVVNTAIDGNPTERLRISSSGSSTFAGEVIAPSGVNFPDDASTNPSSDVNTLDSYEEGTWSPTFHEGANTLTFPSGTAVYTKIGNMVHLSYGLDNKTTSGTVSGTGQFQIRGLPFAPKAGITHVGSVVEYSTVTFAGAGDVYVVGAGDGSNTILNLYQRNDAQTLQNANITGLGANSYFSFQISYPV